MFTKERLEQTMERINVPVIISASLKTTIATRMREEITFLEENDNGEVDLSTLWDTLKAIFRGRIIKKTTKINKQRTEKS